MVARLYEQGKALSEASSFEIDDVIDPVDSRHRITMALRSAPPPQRWGADGKGEKKRPHVDTW
jgi:acetyl-CoA carboxylase carboxyltransferase component